MERLATYTITRWLEIDAGHRVRLHKSKCGQLHGHRYKIGIRLQGALDQIGVVRDFSDIKSTIGGWLDTYLDHGMILEQGDWWIDVLHNADPMQKIYELPGPATAENLARHLYEVFRSLEPMTTGVIVYETPNCFAEYPASVAP